MRKYCLFILFFGIYSSKAQNPVCFNQTTLSSLNFWTLGMDTGDLNNDHIIDFIRPIGSSVSIVLSNGYGNYTQTYTISTNLPCRGNKICDLNNDNFNDLIAVPYVDSNRVYFFFGNGTGTFTSSSSFSVNGIKDIVIGDFNHDGNVDLVTYSNPSMIIKVHLGDGLGNFSSSQTYTISNASFKMQTGNFNNDSYLDLLVGNGSNATIFKGNGNGTFSIATNINLVTPYFKIFDCIDINQDGKDDIIYSELFSYSLKVIFTGNNFYFPSAQNYTSTEYITAISHGDFNSDGKLDLVTAGSIFTTFLVNTGSGFINPTHADTVSAGIQYIDQIFPIHLNNDGKLDVIYTVDNTSNLPTLINCNEVGLSQYQLEKDLLKIYPNPCKDMLFLDNVSFYDVIKIEISDLTGRKIMEIKMKENCNTIAIDDLPEGCYLLKIFDQTSLFHTQKFLVSRY